VKNGDTSKLQAKTKWTLLLRHSGCIRLYSGM